jgi:hypothetical protein
MTLPWPETKGQKAAQGPPCGVEQKRNATGDPRAADYNEMRTHLGLSKDAPLPRAVQRSGAVVTVPILSGLHHHYARI